MNHYDWLDKHLPTIFEKVGINWDNNAGIVVCHGDKGYSYKTEWQEKGIHFYHAMAIYLMSFCQPYSSEVRETEKGWVAPYQWVVDNYDRFKQFLPNVEE